MSNTLILPMAVPLWDSELESKVVERPAPALVDAEPRPRRQRARAERVGMFGSGYRVVVEDRQVALVNLSMSGAQVCGAIHAARDQPLIFKIGWPQDREACAAIARVRWVNLESEEARREAIYRIGLAFETWDVRRLKEIIRHCERTFASKVEVIGPW
jgi:PilZ domain